MRNVTSVHVVALNEAVAADGDDDCGGGDSSSDDDDDEVDDINIARRILRSERADSDGGDNENDAVGDDDRSVSKPPTTSTISGLVPATSLLTHPSLLPSHYHAVSF